MSNLDVAAVRVEFPALKQEQVYFDNAGGSQTLGSVIDSIRDYLLKNNVQLGASYKTGKISTARCDDGIKAGAAYVNAGEDEIVYGPSTTQLFRNVSWTLQFDEGDEIILSNVDHEANIAPWLNLAERQKLVVKWWPPPSQSPSQTTNPKLLPSDLKALLTPKTRLVTCTHASNILGSITDVKAVCETVQSYYDSSTSSPDSASQRKPLVCVDAVAYAPHRAIDVKDLGVDIYTFSWYKVYGPHMAMLYARRDTTQTQMRSLGHYFNPSATLENKIGLAGANYELVQSVPAILEYLGVDKGHSRWPAVEEHEKLLQTTLLDYLNGNPDFFTVYGETSTDTAVRVATISFRVKGWSSKEIVEAIEKDTNFGFRWGAFYSNRLVKEVLGLPEDGVVRVSMVHYNTLEEIKSFIEALDKIVSKKQ